MGSKLLAISSTVFLRLLLLTVIVDDRAKVGEILRVPVLRSRDFETSATDGFLLS